MILLDSGKCINVLLVFCVAVFIYSYITDFLYYEITIPCFNRSYKYLNMYQVLWLGVEQYIYYRTLKMCRTNKCSLKSKLK